MSKTEKTQCETTENNSYTKVNRTYARACIILLALNFCLTGYVLSNLMDIQSVQNETREQAQTRVLMETVQPLSTQAPVETETRGGVPSTGVPTSTKE